MVDIMIEIQKMEAKKTKQNLNTIEKPNNIYSVWSFFLKKRTEHKIETATQVAMEI